MKPCIVAVLVAVSLLARGVSAADPGLLELAMPDAKVLMGIDVRHILASPVGEMVKAQLGSQTPDMAKLMEWGGFDPFRDLDEILIASPGGQKNRPALVAVRGSFNPVALTRQLKEAGTVLDVINGIEILAGPKPNRDTPVHGMAFLDASTVVAGDLASLRQAIHNRGAGVQINPEMRDEVEAISAQYELWLIAEAPSDALAGKLPSGDASQMPQLKSFQSIRRFSGGLRFSPDMEIAAEMLARSQKDAEELASAIRLLAGLFQANQAKEGSRAGPNLLDTLQITVEGSALRLSLTIPEAELREAFERQAAKAGTAPAQRPRPKVAPGRNPNEIIIESSPKDMGTVVITVPNQR